MSKHLNAMQIKGLDKLGDIYAPGDEDFLSFSAAKCSAEADRVMDYMTPSDLADLKLLLTLMGILPSFLIRGFLAFLEKSPGMPGWIGAPLRFVRLGIRGLCLTLYYSHPQAHKVLGYQVGVYTGDFKDPEMERAKTAVSLGSANHDRSL